jgi:hypothetical protein
MTIPLNRQLSDDDLELLSAYIDDQLVAEERRALDERLSREPNLRTALDELRGTVALLSELEPLGPPRSFTLDPAAFAPRRSPLFGWLRLGATLASVLLALTFAVDFVGSGRVASQAGAPVSAPLSPFSAPPEAPAFSSVPAAGGAAAAPTVAPAAESQAAREPSAALKAAEPTAAPAAAEPAPMAAAGAEPGVTTAPAAAEALPTPSEEAAGETTQSADASTTGRGAAAATAAPAAQDSATGYAPPAAPPLPIAESGNQSPGTARLEQPDIGNQPAPAERQAAPAISAIRLVEVSLAALALLLGLGALWARRR